MGGDESVRGFAPGFALGFALGFVPAFALGFAGFALGFALGFAPGMTNRLGRTAPWVTLRPFVFRGFTGKGRWLMNLRQMLGAAWYD